MATAIATLAFCLTIISLAVSPDRVSIAFTVFPLAIAFGFLPVRNQQWVWLAIVPWAQILNLVDLSVSGASVGQFPFYRSEAFLLLTAAILVLNLQQPVKAAIIALRSVEAYAAWMIIAAMAALPDVASQPLLRSFRTALITWLCFRIAAAIGPAGIATLAGSATAWVGVLGLSAIYNAVNSNGPSIVASIGSIVGSSEIMAIQMSFLLPVALSYGLYSLPKNRVILVGAWLAVVVGSCALLLSFSRSGWVGGFIGMTFVAAASLSRNRRSVKLGALWAAVIVLLGSAVLVATRLVLQKEYGDLIQRFRSLVSSGLWDDRLPAWSAALSTLHKHPLIGDLQAPNCYNLFLGVGSRSGWPALVLFLAAILCSTKHLIHSIYTGACESLKLGLIGGVAGFLITGIGESSLGTRMTPIFFTVIGLLAGTYHDVVCGRPANPALCGRIGGLERYVEPPESECEHRVMTEMMIRIDQVRVPNGTASTLASTPTQGRES